MSKIARGAADGPRKIFGRENVNWQGAVSASGDRVAGDRNHAVSDFAPGMDRVSVLSPEFRDVLLDRYDCDPREVDEQRVRLVNACVATDRALSSVVQRKREYEESPRASYYADRIAAAEDRIVALSGQLEEQQRECAEFEREYPVQWQQYYLVSGGHFHKSLGCSTLRPTTNVGMCPAASGLEEDEAVELAGSRVCTHCVPDAPVDILSRPSHVWTDDEREEIAQREQREQEKRDREAEKKRKAAERSAAQQRRKADPKTTLDEPIHIPTLTTDSWNANPDEVATVKGLREALKNSMDKSATSLNGLHADRDFESASMEREMIAGLYNKHDAVHADRCAAVLRDNFHDPMKYWAASLCEGDVDQMVRDLDEVRAGVEVLAGKRGKPFGKMMDDVYGKRTMSKIERDARADHLLHQWAERPIHEDVVQRAHLVRGWIMDPESFRAFLD